MFIERFIRYLQFEKRFSPNTVTAYKKDLDQFSQFIVSFQLELLDVTHQHVRTWIVSLMDHGIETRTINRKISSLRSFYKFLQREDLIGNSPMIYVRAPKIPKLLPIVITEQKMDILLDAQNVFSNDFQGIRDRVIVELLYGTGMRLSELVNLSD
ncbi:MAG: site-specific integrase, partial [Bacteroidetes bacterium]|nr:site-specific integrase [Bacteroidota bacterium]